MAHWTVKGLRLVEASDGVTSWEPFESDVVAADKETARWKGRRANAPGTKLAELEATPPNDERELVEMNDPDHPRTAARTGAEVAEYERLTDNVRIESVVEA